MARTGRPPAKMPRVRFDTYIRADIAAKVKLLLEDPLRGKQRYGDRSNLVESLLERWLVEQRAAAFQSQEQAKREAERIGAGVSPENKLPGAGEG